MDEVCFASYGRYNRAVVLFNRMAQQTLEITTPQGSTRVPLGREAVSIGRQAGNTVVIDDVEASRNHCVFERVAAGVQVRDLGSRNGTKVNGQLINTALLLDGDVVKIGKTEMRVIVEVAAAAKPRARAVETAALAGDETAATGVVVSPTASGGFDDLRRAGLPGMDALMQLADSLPEQSIKVSDITLLNARGHVSHAAGVAKRDGDNSGEAVNLLRMILLICFRTHASDIHIEPKNDLFVVRIRIDGSMIEAAQLKKEIGIRLNAVIKILCDIDIAQRNIVQEGHFSTRVPDRRVDYRVSFTPSMYGQKCVIRVLDTASAPRYLWDLRLPDWMFQSIDKAIRGDSGMVLVCGPTGSGKTASLYAALRSIDSGERNVVTIEDPVEFQIDGITQMPVNEAQGNTFPALLRSVLRQDPDVVLVGEVRDGETAKTAMQAAMTGHLVFSTIHSRDTISAIFRLQDLGIEPYLISSGLQILLAQRLIRRLCPFCKVGLRPTPEQAAVLEPAAGKVGRIFRSQGCARCLNTGFAGRQGVFEVLAVTEAIRDAIAKTPNAADISAALAGTKFTKLLQSGYKLVAEGVTTLDEIERALGQ
jgi:type II secretory ATPase GspE/PulE/Tfp pilus assembly ATPase PilB-like protein